MKILNVHTRHFESHIILKDFQAVVEALTLFSSADEVSSRFAGRVLSQIQQQLQSDDHFKFDYGYLGAGVFKDTIVEVIKTVSPGAPYLLHLSTANIGNQAEARVAKAMRAELGLQKIEVQLELAPEVGQFEVDFKMIFNFLRREARTPRPEVMVESIFNYNRNTIGAGYVRLSDYSSQVQLRIDKESVGPFYDFSASRPAWRKDGAVVRGPLRQRRKGEEYYNPRVIIGITASPQNRLKIRGHTLPITNRQVKARARHAAEKIASSFPDQLRTSPTKTSLPM